MYTFRSFVERFTAGGGFFFALLALQMRFSKGKTVLFNFKTVKKSPAGLGSGPNLGGHLQNDPNQGAARGGAVQTLILPPARPQPGLPGTRTGVGQSGTLFLEFSKTSIVALLTVTVPLQNRE